jgi:hypothetical protein
MPALPASAATALPSATNPIEVVMVPPQAAPDFVRLKAPTRIELVYEALQASA